MKGSLQQTILLVVALVVANCQCALICTGAPNQRFSYHLQEKSQAPPPCHEHTSPKQSQQEKGDNTSPNCAHSPVVAEEGASSATVQTLAQLPHDSTPVGPMAAFFFSAIARAPAQYAASPPLSPELVRSKVLRV
jgi:hypothetical protein